MLNTRCLAIVFDLDETLIVANTMKSFEDRIEALVGWIARETDPIRESGMTAEMKRYVEDRALLKQYADTDSVVDGGKVYKMQHEEVPLLSDGVHRVVRPVVRLPEKNIVLTRINPEVRRDFQGLFIHGLFTLFFRNVHAPNLLTLQTSNL